MIKKAAIPGIFLLILFSAGTLFAWHDKTHLAVAKAAGYEAWYNAAGADMAKEKAGKVEQYNHYFNNIKGLEVTPEMVTGQARYYNSNSDSEGHLYGAIVGALRTYADNAKSGKYREYHMAFAAHYIGDLSMPLHNSIYDTFNNQRHTVNDGIVEADVLENTGRIEQQMYAIRLRDEHFEEDLIREIVRIANISRALNRKIRAENRDMTQDEVYVQLGHSASLLKAVLAHYRNMR